MKKIIVILLSIFLLSSCAIKTLNLSIKNPINPSILKPGVTKKLNSCSNYYETLSLIKQEYGFTIGDKINLVDNFKGRRIKSGWQNGGKFNDYRDSRIFYDAKRGNISFIYLLKGYCFYGFEIGKAEFNEVKTEISKHLKVEKQWNDKWDNDQKTSQTGTNLNYVVFLVKQYNLNINFYFEDEILTSVLLYDSLN